VGRTSSWSCRLADFDVRDTDICLTARAVADVKITKFLKMFLSNFVFS
jgi:hypothetical protein